MGTPDFAVPSLKRLVAEGYTVAGVFTQPDRPKGRGNKLTKSPVKLAAEDFGTALELLLLFLKPGLLLRRLGGDQDDAVAAPGAVDGRGSVFQDAHGPDVIGIEE